MGKSEFLFFDRLIGRNWHIADIGANQGLYTLYFSSQVPEGRVYSFEPDPKLFAALHENIDRNGANNVVLFNAAAASQTGRLALRAGQFNRGDNRIVPDNLACAFARPSARRDYSGTVEVDAVPLDRVIPDLHLDLLKIDVQGFEAQVLRGAERLIQANHNLVIFLEFWPYGLKIAGSGPEELLDILSKAGFSIFRHGNAKIAQPFLYRTNEWSRAGKFCNLVATRRQIFG